MSKYYGAFELKQSYQKNLILGLVAAVTINLFCVLIITIYPMIFPEAKVEKITRVWSISQLISPPPPPEITEEGMSESSSDGIHQPVPKVSRDYNISLRTKYRGETYGFVYDMSTTGIEVSSENSSIEIGTPQKLKIDLVPADRLPECIRSVLPKYPDLAKQNGLEGEVWLQVLVDKRGKVKDVNIFRKARVESGFEEAATQAAWQWEYRPALCNNQPVAVWIVYTLKFKLKPTQVASR
jgi:TonB family protein